MSRFVDELRREISQQLGQDFPIFRDREHLEWGQNWRRRIDESLDSVTFLIAILSPSFFRSEECRRELDRFRERERQLGRDDLILSVVWIKPDEFADEKNQLTEFLRQRQYVSWERFRHHRSLTVTAKRQIASLARQVVAAIRRPDTPGTGASSPKRSRRGAEPKNLGQRVKPRNSNSRREPKLETRERNSAERRVSGRPLGRFPPTRRRAH